MTNPNGDNNEKEQCAKHQPLPKQIKVESGKRDKPEKEKKNKNRKKDPVTMSSEDSFPASDPPAWNMGKEN